MEVAKRNLAGDYCQEVEKTRSKIRTRPWESGDVVFPKRVVLAGRALPVPERKENRFAVCPYRLKEHSGPTGHNLWSLSQSQVRPVQERMFQLVKASLQLLHKLYIALLYTTLQPLVQ